MEKVISMLRAKRFEVWGRGCWEEGFKQREQKIHRFREEREQSTFGPSEVDCGSRTENKMDNGERGNHTEKQWPVLKVFACDFKAYKGKAESLQCLK